MIYYYVPKKLLEAKEHIQNIHKKAVETTVGDMNNRQFKQLVYEIVALESEMLEGYSYTLKKEEISLLANYIPGNHFNVKIDHLLGVLKYRWDSQIMKTLYQHWQNYYINMENIKIFSYIGAENEGFLNEFLTLYTVSPKEVQMSIETGTVVELFSKTAAEFNANSKEEFEESLQSIGLNLQFSLAKECIKEFYFVCSGDVYVKLGDRKVFDLFRTMHPESTKRILVNMLKKLSDQQLDQFEEVLNYYYRRTGDRGRGEFNSYFSDIDKALVNKYGTWLNRWNIRRIFLKDTKDRNKFWLKFANDSRVRTSYAKQTDCLILHFPKSVFIEFREIGPVYQYNHDYYEAEVSKMVERTSKDTDLKRWLRNVSDYKMLQEHRGHWEEKVEERIRVSF